MTAARAYAFGEILWDFLPSGRHAGGAPFNVCVHLAQLGMSAGLISAVGRDELGDELLNLAKGRSVDTRFVCRANEKLPTGTVRAEVDALGNASYEIVAPAAWDEIDVNSAAFEEVRRSRAFVYGSLAGRSAKSRQVLEQLLSTPGPLRLFDVNLRPPFADLALVHDLARHAHVIKLNDDELGLLARWLHAKDSSPHPLRGENELVSACAILAKETGVQKICVTRGAAGAVFWEGGDLTVAAAPKVLVRDTVGAGDAFMACLVRGLVHGVATSHVLEAACKVGAFVASAHGATPPLPPELREFGRVGSPD